MNKRIVVTNSFKGCHKYADAPDCVAFLRNVHRHVFNVKTTIEVTHNNRDIEFFMLQDEIEGFVRYRYAATEGLVDIYIESCEVLAEALLLHLHEVYPNRQVRVEVWEDNENGAIVED